MGRSVIDRGFKLCPEHDEKLNMLSITLHLPKSLLVREAINMLWARYKDAHFGDPFPRKDGS